MKKTIFAFIALLSTVIISAQAFHGANTRLSPEDRLNKEYCSGLFETTDGTIIDITANPGANAYINILDWLQGRVAGLQVITTKQGVRFPIIRGQVPGIYIDEVPVNAGFINSLNVNDIAMIKIIKTPFYGGFNGGGGAVAIYTLRGEDEEGEE